MLTTEQLRARAKFWRETAVEAKWESVSIAQDMLLNADAFDELAANREAQPVGYIDPGSLKEYRGQRAGGTWSAVQRTTSGLNMTTPIYTAPPAPANALPVAWEMRYWNSGHNMWHDWERITAEQHAEMSVQHAKDNDYEFRVLYDAPPAPQSTNAADWGINMQTGTPILVYKNCSVIESEQAHYVLSLINCAAMPTPAVPEEMKRDPDADVFDPGFMNGWNACRAVMLAAAPEGGNDHDTRR